MSGWFETIREECSRANWSRGVDLARARAVHAERVDPTEAVFRVTNPGGMLAPTVTLRLDDPAWDCDCPGSDDPCAHVAAAAIALRRSQREGNELPSAGAEGAGHVRYCLFREEQGVGFERRVVAGESETRLDASLKAITAGQAKGPRCLPTESDLAAELALASVDLLRGHHRLSQRAVERLIPALAACEDVRLDGEPVQVSSEPVMPQGHLRDQDNGFRLNIEPDPSITEVLDNHLVLCGNTLRPVREVRLDARERADLPRGRHYPLERALDLATEIIPDLQRRIPVEIHTRRLPRTSRAEPPRVRIESRRQGDALVARADLVYGNPVNARIESGRMLHERGAVPVRDEAAERRLARHVQSALELPVGREVSVRDREALALARRLAAWEGEIAGNAHTGFHALPALKPRPALSAGDFDVVFALPDEMAPRRAEARAVFRAWERGDEFVALDGGGFAPLPRDWLERFGRATQNLLEARRDDGALPASSLPDLARLCESLGEAPPAEFARLRAIMDGFDRIPRATLPDDLSGTLRDYQRAGVDWLCFLRDAGLGALLADDMGLGKTLQVLCALRGRALVVAPTSVLHNWREEIARFRPGLSVCVFHGPKRMLDDTAHVTLTTYATLRLDAALLAAPDWDAVVLDEAQAVKNPDSQVARAAYGLRGSWRVTVTGTPVENRLEELWSQLHFGNPGLLGSRNDFQQRYGRPMAAGVPGVADELRTRIRPFVLRRLKRDVAPELPPRTEMTLHCELDDEERQVYDAVRAATRADVVSQLQQGGSVLAALEALLRLRQAACHRDLVPGQQAAGSSKLTLLREELDTVVADGHKALVFSQWTGLLDRIEPHLRSAGIGFSRLDGSTRDRGAVVDAFQSEDGPPVMLISLKAGGTGLNLTAADHVFLMDPWWNPAVEEQAADRTHRIGQTRPVMIYRLVATDTVEERILDLQHRKRALADAALGGAALATSLGRDDLLALLG